MEFSLNEIQSLLKDTADRLVREKYSFEQRKAFVAEPLGFSQANWAEFAELGLTGVEIPEEHGGTGGDFRDLAVVVESFGRGMVVEPYIPTVVMGAGLIARAGSAGQQADLLPKIAAGEARIAIAYEESGTRYHTENIAMKAAKSDNGYVLNGTKSLVLAADSATHMVVAVRTSGAPGDTSGISLLVIPADTDGISLQTYANLDDTHASEVTFENVKAPASALLGGEGDGLAPLNHAIDRAAAAICYDALGAMTALNEITLEYLKTRHQFGRPIGKFQVLQHRMADMMMAEQQARSMVLLAADHADSEDAGERGRAISAAKVQVSSAAREVGRGSIQLHGGIGMTMEYVAGHYFRRLTAMEKMFGDMDFHLQRFGRTQ